MSSPNKEDKLNVGKRNEIEDAIQNITNKTDIKKQKNNNIYVKYC